MNQALIDSVDVNAIPLLSIVALLVDLPEEKLLRGYVGTVVEILAPDAVEVEFVDRNGHTCALAAVPTDQLIALHPKALPIA